MKRPTEGSLRKNFPEEASAFFDPMEPDITLEDFAKHYHYGDEIIEDETFEELRNAFEKLCNVYGRKAGRLLTLDYANDKAFFSSYTIH